MIGRDVAEASPDDAFCGLLIGRDVAEASPDDLHIFWGQNGMIRFEGGVWQTICDNFGKIDLKKINF